MQNLVSCVYEVKLAGLCRRITVTWLKDAKGHGLSVTLDDSAFQYTCKVKVQPWSFWKKQGMKTLEFCNTKVDVLWDLSAAHYTYGPEPHKGFYVAMTCNGVMVLLLGDKDKDACKKAKAQSGSTHSTLVSRTEHVFGSKRFHAKARLGDCGKAYDIDIECPHADNPYLSIRVDKQMAIQVKNLDWKFRGNQTVLVDGTPVEVFWDVHNWIFNVGGNGVHSASFIFQVPSEPKKPDKILEMENMIKWSGELNGSISVMKLRGTRSLKCACDVATTVGSSLMLHAWKTL